MAKIIIKYFVLTILFILLYNLFFGGSEEIAVDIFKKAGLKDIKDIGFNFSR